MSEKIIISRVAKDMIIEQLKWSVWFSCIILIIHIALSIASVFYNTIEINYDFFGFSFFSTPVYMLVIGIIAGAYFLPFFVKHGVTRKDYFIGSSVAAFGLSVLLTVIFGILSVIEFAVFKLIQLPIAFKPFDLAASDLLLGDSMFLSIILQVLYIWAFYLIGWFVQTGFYRFNWMIGLVFCVAAILFTSLISGGTIYGIETANLPTQYVLLSTIIIIAIVLFLIRMVTRKVPIKL